MGIRVLDEGDGGVDDLAEVVRRDVGRHADGDAARSVDEQLRELRREDRRLDLGVVVVRDEVDGLLVDVGEQLDRDARQAALGVTHGGGESPSTAAVVALAVDERVPQAEVLGHADERVVHGESPCGWYLPSTSPTTRAHFLCAPLGPIFCS
jgi:hypothetical protein